MFEKIIGNSKTKNYLEASIGNGKTSHSYMFVGIEGIGKKLVAMDFAKRMLCLNEKDGACNCKSCLEFETSNHPDFNIIEPDGNSLKIEQIRELQRKIQEKPIISRKKIYIIDNAEKMTTEAQNCLLKTLEEPPEFAILILIGSNESLFLDTIKSRCIILHFDKIDNKDLKEFLNKNFELQVNDEVLKIFQGSIGKAIELKDKIEEYEQIGEMLKQLNSKDMLSIMEMAKPMYAAKEEIYQILEYINVELLELSKKDYRFTNCIKIVENTNDRLKKNSNFDMCIDNLLFNMWREVN